MIEEEEKKTQMWKDYFARNGVGLSIDLLRTSEFEELLITVGLPNSLRPRIWQICSGSIYNMLVCSNYEKIEKHNRAKARKEKGKTEKDKGKSATEERKASPQIKRGISEIGRAHV